MTISLYAASVPVFKQMLGSVSAVLTLAEAHAEARKIEPTVFLQARLFPDMFPLLRQVQIACEHARGAAARLSGVEIPKYENTEQSFADLQALISSTLAFLDGFAPAQIDGREECEVVLRAGTPKERRLTAQAFLLSFAIPQFFFHVNTSYAILRSNGVEIGKKDYMGAY
ncbi:MAG: DUF1993 domain-containing protein [Moraxellaceae bacterium]